MQRVCIFLSDRHCQTRSIYIDLMSSLRRLKVSSPYYSEFKHEVPASADSAADTGAHSAAAAADSGQLAAATLSAAAIRSKVEAAVAAVMGAVPSATEPLVEAGLDSLGGLLPPTSASVAEAQAQDWTVT
jgi:hypothetical protein